MIRRSLFHSILSLLVLGVFTLSQASAYSCDQELHEERAIEDEIEDSSEEERHKGRTCIFMTDHVFAETMFSALASLTFYKAAIPIECPVQETSTSLYLFYCCLRLEGV